jgi:hypothetical protein
VLLILTASSVQATFWIFTAIFTALLIAELSIMIKFIKTGPEKSKIMEEPNYDNTTNESFIFSAILVVFVSCWAHFLFSSFCSGGQNSYFHYSKK